MVILLLFCDLTCLKMLRFSIYDSNNFILLSVVSDRFTQHRYKCDQAFELDGSKGPVAQYLDIANIVKICKTNNVQAVHPGYGLLSENEKFADALTQAGITFVGPTVSNLTTFGNKATARNVAVKNGVPVVPGSEEAFATVQEAREWIDDPANKCDYPVIVKALMVCCCFYGWCFYHAS